MTRQDRIGLALVLAVALCALSTIFAQLGIARGRDLERRRWERQAQTQRAEAPAVPVGVAPPRDEAPPPLRCVQRVEFDKRNTPSAIRRPLTRGEIEARYHLAKMYLETAEAAGLWNDRGRRSLMLAMGIFLEILVCRGGEP